MEYRINDLRLEYVDDIPEEYTVSNRDLTVVVKRGRPHRILSPSVGVVLEDFEVNLPSPENSIFEPGGCAFESNGMKWKFVTTPDVSSIVWKIETEDRISLEFNASLSMKVEVPFWESVELSGDFYYEISQNRLRISDVFVVEIEKGKLHDLKNPDGRKLCFQADPIDDIVEISFKLKDADEDVESLHRDYMRYLSNVCGNVSDPVQKLLLANSIHTVLASFKNFGSIRAMCAGVDYMFPPRTYFRDSFWPCLVLLELKPELVREQIISLSLGVHSDGCPSGVLLLEDDFKRFLESIIPKLPTEIKRFIRYPVDWWSDHLDSPAFFVLLVYEYLGKTGDLSVLHEVIDDESILEKLRNVLLYMDSLDENGDDLMNKPLSPNDWADNVLRNGLVTYDAALETAAFRAGAKLFEMIGESEFSEHLMKRYHVKRKSFNENLWSDEKGYFINFKGDYVEDNLSLDTAVAFLFGVADDDKVRSSLEKMERFLETRNNSEQPYGDWGVMCVWPPYKCADHLFGKSAVPYNYHNGSCWPYLCGVYALSKRKYGMDYEYPLISWWKYSLDEGWINPVEYYSPPHGRGSLEQAWSGFCAILFLRRDEA